MPPYTSPPLVLKSGQLVTSTALQIDAEAPHTHRPLFLGLFLNTCFWCDKAQQAKATDEPQAGCGSEGLQAQ